MKKNYRNANLKIVAIIPARGGSKGIPGKNIKNLAGKPMIAYTIEAAKRSRYINRIIVSTDDSLIARVSTKYGAEVPVMRPKSLATDSTSILSVLRHMIHQLQKTERYIPDVLVLLQPTSPLRTSHTIDQGIRMFLEHGKQTVVAVKEAKENPFWMKVIRNKYLYPFVQNKPQYTKRQDLPKIYIVNGALYICEVKKILETDPFNEDKIIPFVMNRRESLDVDDMEDVTLAECLIRLRGIPRP